jgi:hypothetical protein
MSECRIRRREKVNITCVLKQEILWRGRWGAGLVARI